MKKYRYYLVLLLVGILGMWGCSSNDIKEVATDDTDVISTKQPGDEATEEPEESSEPVATEDTNMGTEVSGNNLQETRKETAITFDNSETRVVTSEQEAIEAINAEGEKQRATYSNPEINKIELKMQEQYGILQVNLGEMSQEMASKVESAFSYMFEKYPILKGKISNLTLGNLPGENVLAKVDYRAFISPQDDIYPIVMKHEIILNARDFLNQERLENTINRTVRESQWMEGMNIEGLIVHELGHILLDVLRMEHYGIVSPFYITKEQEEAYAGFNTDELASNQTMLKEVLQDSYKDYKEGTGNEITFEEFCKSISGYASGIKEDGGQSYDETCAEVFVDEYLHDGQCCESAGYILDNIKEKIR